VPAFFTSLNGTRLLYAVVQSTFRQLINDAGIGVGAPWPPRLHDLRHYADGWVMCPAVAFLLLGAAELVLQSA
jgi:integrase